MRKKQFEKIPPAYEGKKCEGKCMMDAFVHDDILAVDFYHEAAGVWKILWRTLISETEFTNYKYSEAYWNAQQLESMATEYGWPSLWGGNAKAGKDYLMKPETKEIIEDYIKKTGGTIWNDIWCTLTRREYYISVERRETAEDRKFLRIQNKMQDVPPIPGDFRQFIVDNLYKNKHFLYFSKTQAVCARCGKTVRMPAGIKHNAHGVCPKCGQDVIFKSTGRMESNEEKKEVLLIQKWNNEVVLRYFRCSLYSEFGKKEDLEYTESVRTYHERKIEYYRNRYIHYKDNWRNGTFWSDKMIGGTMVSYGTNCCLYAGNLAEIEDVLKEKINFPIRELAEDGITIPWKYIFMGQELKNSNFEKLYKAGLHKLALEYIRNQNVSISYRQRELKKLLGITKPMLGYMQKHDSNKKVLEVLQDAKKDNHGLNDNEIFVLAEAGIKVSELAAVAEKRKLIKLLHYLQKAAGYKNLRTKYQHYVDYMGMVGAMNYDLTNDTVRYPKNLKAAHDKAVSEYYEGETDKKKQEAMRKYPVIAIVADKLEQEYGYHDKHYLIRAPRGANEIVEEGRKLHHCVGGDIYLSRHNAGKSFILFMRKIGTPEEQYYTIEIDPKTYSILQYYGYNDKKPDKEEVDKFLDKWKKNLKSKRKQLMTA